MYVLSCSPSGLYHARLPIAPRINHKFVSRNFDVSREFIAFKNDVEKLARVYGNIKPIPKLYLKKGNRHFQKNVCMEIHIYEIDNKRDIDATEKVIQDVLQGKFYENDSQIWTKRTLQYVNAKDPCVEVFVWECTRVYFTNPNFSRSILKSPGG